MLDTIASLSEHRSSQLKTSVFVRPRLKEKPASPNISTLESVFENIRFRWPFSLIRVDNRPNRKKKYPFSSKNWCVWTGPLIGSMQWTEYMHVRPVCLFTRVFKQHVWKTLYIYILYKPTSYSWAKMNQVIWSQWSGPLRKFWLLLLIVVVINKTFLHRSCLKSSSFKNDKLVKCCYRIYSK